MIARRIFPCFIVVLLAWQPVLGQNAAASGESTAKAKFDALFAEYKQVLREIEERRNSYQAADATTRQEINQNLGALVDRGQQLIDRMGEAGLAAFRETDGEEQALQDFLLAVAEHAVVGRALDKDGHQRTGGDQYERAMPFVDALLEAGVEDPRLPAWGFVCAFNMNDYDRAETLLNEAQQQEAFKDPGSLKDPAQQQFMGLALQLSSLMDDYRQYWEVEQAIRAAEAEADDLPRVKLTTTQGDITIELFENEAPIATANMISLVKDGYYDGITFHRVLPGFMAQGGCPEGTGLGGPGYTIRCECRQPNHRKHFRGSLSMAKTLAPDTGGSQFFLTFIPTDHLNGEHTVFGRVIEGVDVLGELTRRNPKDDPNPPAPDKIIRAQVLRDRGHAYDFEKLPEK